MTEHTAQVLTFSKNEARTLCNFVEDVPDEFGKLLLALDDAQDAAGSRFIIVQVVETDGEVV
jgi:hypothetical protein